VPLSAGSPEVFAPEHLWARRGGAPSLQVPLKDEKIVNVKCQRNCGNAVTLLIQRINKQKRALRPCTPAQGWFAATTFRNPAPFSVPQRAAVAISNREGCAVRWSSVQKNIYRLSILACGAVAAGRQGNGFRHFVPKALLAPTR